MSGAQIDTDMAVWRTVPTTWAGRLALVDYARFQARVRTAPDGYIDNAEGLIEEILAAFSAAIDVEATAVRLAEALDFIARVRISDMRFRWHRRRRERHEEHAAGHLRAMVAEMERRADLCARYGGRPGPPAPRSGSGIPLVPRPSHQVTDTVSGPSAAVPSDG